MVSVYINSVSDMYEVLFLTSLNGLDHLYRWLPPKLQQRDGTEISSAFLTDYFADDVQKLLFLENNLFFYLSFYFVNSTPLRPDQTNVDSHIFVLMYVDGKIVKWTVINNVNMFFSE